MKKLLTIIMAATVGFGVQAQDLPKPSPAAKVEQRVGLTDISITYSRPGVKGRTIWGDLVPWNELWRAGANKATLIETNKDVKLNGAVLPAGSYSLFILPKEGDTWTIVFNKETELWGTGDYKESEDQLRVDAQVSNLGEISERLEYRFLNVDMNRGQLVMDWEKKRVTIEIDADPSEHVKENIATAIAEADEENKWKVYRSAAAYANDNGGMTEQGLEWIEKSVALKDNWYSYWVYADLKAQAKDYKGAIAMAKKAIEIGEKDAKDNGKEFKYASRLNEEIAGYQAKMK